MQHILGKLFFITIFSVILNANSSFRLDLSKDKVYVGEPIKATLILSYDNKSPIINIDFDEFIAPNFWIKELDESDPIKKGDFTYVYYTFLLFPQIEGNLTILPQLLKTAIRENKTNLIIWSDNYSKEKVVEVSGLPKELKILGNYTIQASVDNKTIKQNQPINLTITLKGNGNFDDIKPFKIKTKKQLVFTTKPILKANFKDGKYQGAFIQKFSIIADKDFIIPSINFKYFNTDTKMIEIIQTKKIKIKVTNTLPQIKSENKYLIYIYSIIGFIFGISTLYIFNYLRSRSNKVILPISIKIKKAKNDKQLYKILLPYSNHILLVKVMKDLEENIYKNGKNKISKVEINSILDIIEI